MYYYEAFQSQYQDIIAEMIKVIRKGSLFC